MKCPHCRVELRLVDRPKRQCSKCKKAIALEPREDPLGLSDLRLRALADKLSDQGKLYYTPTQLFYYANRKQVDAQQKQLPGWFGCLIPIGMFGGFIVLGATESLFGCFGFLALIALVGFAFVQWRRRNGPRRVTLSLDTTKFYQIITSRWPTVYGALPVGWQAPHPRSRSHGLVPSRQPLRALLVCPTADILFCVDTNGLAETLGIGLLWLTNEPLSNDEQHFLRRLRQQPQVPVLLLHDASIDGCLFVQKARQRLGLSDQHRIINLGLHPRQAMRDNLMRLRSPADIEKLAQLKALVNPAHHGAGGQSAQPPALGQLTSAEYEWLAQGYYTPLLSITPKRLLKTVTQGFLAATPAAAQLQRGFMDWPEPQGVA